MTIKRLLLAAQILAGVSWGSEIQFTNLYSTTSQEVIYFQGVSYDGISQEFGYEPDSPIFSDTVVAVADMDYCSVCDPNGYVSFLYNYIGEYAVVEFPDANGETYWYYFSEGCTTYNGTCATVPWTGLVNVGTVTVVGANTGGTGPPGTPEPASVILIVSGILAMVLARRRGKISTDESTVPASSMAHTEGLIL